MLSDSRRALPGAARRLLVLLLVLLPASTVSALDAHASAAGAPAVAPAVTATGAYHPVAPVRVVDSRLGPFTRLPANTDRAIKLAGVGGVPTTGVLAVALNLTVTAPSRAGYATLDPANTNAPRSTSTINFTTSAVANSVVTKLDANGKVYLRSTADIDFVVDVMGWYGPLSTATHPVSPARVLDTRSGIGATAGLVPGNSSVTLQIAGRGGVPASGVSSVVLNLTSTGSTGPGWATAYPSGTGQTAGASLNFTNAVTAGTVYAKVGADGRITVTVSRSTHLIADVTAWYGDTQDLTTVAPQRVLDTRVGLGGERKKVAAGTAVTFPVAGRAGAPNEIQAAVLTVSAVTPSATGYLTAYGAGNSRPTASVLNYVGGVTRSNTVIVPINETMPAVVYSSATTDVVVDMVGYVLVGSLDPHSRAVKGVVGENNACFIAESAELSCAGLNTSGVLDAADVGYRSLVRINTSVTDVVDVDVTPASLGGITTFPSTNHACALDSAGKVFCWGSNSNGQLGTETPFRVNGKWLPVAGLPTAVDVAVGDRFSCASTTTGEVWCWGGNGVRQLGDGTTVPSAAPVKVVGVSGATAVSAGSANACARTSSGDVWCWGRNDFGVLGTGNTVASTVPVKVPALEAASAVDVGPRHACAIEVAQQVTCWGAVNSIGPFVGNQPGSAAVTAPLALPDTWADSIAVGGDHTCAIADTLKCWGWDSGQFGTGTVTPTFRGVTALYSDSWPIGAHRTVSADYRATCVVSTILGTYCADGRTDQLTYRTGTGTEGPIRAATPVLGFFP